MPDRPLRICGGCGAKVSKTCPVCSAKREQARGSAHARGYGVTWRAFMGQFVALLIAAGVPPVCGATLPGGPRTQDSQCRAQGLLTGINPDGSALHGDHEPPLQEWERRHASIVCNPLRIQLLCRVCHSLKTGGRV